MGARALDRYRGVPGAGRIWNRPREDHRPGNDAHDRERDECSERAQRLPAGLGLIDAVSPDDFILRGS